MRCTEVHLTFQSHIGLDNMKWVSRGAFLHLRLTGTWDTLHFHLSKIQTAPSGARYLPELSKAPSWITLIPLFIPIKCLTASCRILFLTLQVRQSLFCFPLDIFHIMNFHADFTIIPMSVVFTGKLLTWAAGSCNLFYHLNMNPTDFVWLFFLSSSQHYHKRPSFD